MHIGTIEKKIDYSKTNIGVELECFLVHQDSLREISRPESQKIFQQLIDQQGWNAQPSFSGEIHSVTKKIAGETMEIKLDV